MGRDRPEEPPAGLKVERIEHEGERLLVFSYPENAADEAALPSTVRERLTAAQQEVVELVLAGCSNREIATARGTAAATVAKQLEVIYRRLGINSRRELAAAAGHGSSWPRTPE